MNAQVETLLGDPIEISLAEKTLQLAKLRQKWNGIKDFYNPIVNALSRLGIEPTLDAHLDVQFTGDAHKLASVIRILRTSGFDSISSRPKQGDTSWSAFYRHPNVDVEVFLYFTSSVCRRVKVGTKLVEQDIYQTQCGDSASSVKELTDAVSDAMVLS